MLNALPHPVITVAADGAILGGNDAAEHFFQASIPFMRRHNLTYFIPFGSPLLGLIEKPLPIPATIQEDFESHYEPGTGAAAARPAE